MSKLDDTWFGGEVGKFFGLPVFNRARTTDPVTSHQAADQVTTASKHFQIIHLAFTKLVAAKEREACAKVVEDSLWFTRLVVAKAIKAGGAFA